MYPCTQNSTKEVKMHLLLEFAKRRKFSETPDVPKGAVYSVNDGMWLKDGRPLVSLREYKFGQQVTKKCDQETGEDQKGE